MYRITWINSTQIINIKKKQLINNNIYNLFNKQYKNIIHYFVIVRQARTQNKISGGFTKYNNTNSTAA